MFYLHFIHFADGLRCLPAERMDFGLTVPSVAIKCTKTIESQAKSVWMIRLRKVLTVLTKRLNPAHRPSQVTFGR